MANVTILKLKRHPNGSLEAVYAYTRQITSVQTKESGHPPLPEGWTQEQHEAEFFRRLQAEVDAEVGIEEAADVDDAEGKTIAELLVDAPAPPPAPEPEPDNP